MLRILDADGVAWLWDGRWLDVECPAETCDCGRGYPAHSYDDVLYVFKTLQVEVEPQPCQECGAYPAGWPSKKCVSCQAYAEPAF